MPGANRALSCSDTGRTCRRTPLEKERGTLCVPNVDWLLSQATVYSAVADARKKRVRSVVSGKCTSAASTMYGIPEEGIISDWLLSVPNHSTGVNNPRLAPSALGDGVSCPHFRWIREEAVASKRHRQQAYILFPVLFLCADKVTPFDLHKSLDDLLLE